MIFDIYYHVATGLPSSTQVIASQFPILSRAPYRNLYVCTLGETKHRKEARDLLHKLPNVEFFHEGSLDEYEHPTLAFMQENISTPSIYFHTKGARHNWKAQGTQLYHKWRALLDARVVSNSGRLIEKMIGGGCDMAGALYIDVPKQKIKYFAGNYFAITADYCKNHLPKYRAHASNPEWAGRYKAETWVGRGNKPPKVLTVGQDGAVPLSHIVHQVASWKQ